MARLTLRLPESLRDTLIRRAEEEGVSMNHYVVYSLTKNVSVETVARQRAEFDRLLSRDSAEDSERALTTLLAGRSSD